MKIQSLLFLGVASLALATAQESERGYAEQPSFELLRTSYISPGPQVATTSAGAPMVLTPASSSMPAAAPTAATSGCSDACSSDYKPVCGSDGKTYANVCVLSMAHCKNPGSTVTMQAEGACVESTSAPSTPAPATSAPSKCNQMCTADFTPVCGSDGKTYSNACALSVAQCKSSDVNISKVFEGECGSGAAGATTPAPETPAATTAAPTPEPATTAPAPANTVKCSQMCSSDYTPVCGSNGKTYANACALSVAQCENPNASIAKMSDDECGSGAADSTAPATPATCPEICPANFAPVCGSDGKTYSNACTLSVAQCKSPSVSITKMSEGECGSGAAATTMPAPVTPATEAPSTPAATGTTGTTAPGSVPSPTNPPNPTQVVTSKCEMACTKKYAPVCGSNGKTYNNACLLHLASCKSSTKRKITIKSEGMCSKASSGSTAATQTPASGGVSPSTSSGSDVSPSGSTGTSISTSTSTSTSTTTTGASSFPTAPTSRAPVNKNSYLRGNGNIYSPTQGQ